MPTLTSTYTLFETESPYHYVNQASSSSGLRRFSVSTPVGVLGLQILTVGLKFYVGSGAPNSACQSCGSITFIYWESSFLPYLSK